MVGAIKLGLYP